MIMLSLPFPAWMNRRFLKRVIAFSLLPILFVSQPASPPGLSDYPATSSSLSCPNKMNANNFSTIVHRCRVQAARSKAHTLLNTQSTTVEQAVIEYKRRYHRDPPAGFTDWVQFAFKHNSKIIDDFDQIDRDLKPYRSPEAKEIFKKFNKQKGDWPHISRITFVDGVMTTTGQYIYDGYWERLVEPFMGMLPNNSVFYLNTIDEPRIMSKSGTQSARVKFNDHPGGSIQNLIKDSCTQTPLELSGLHITKDVCQITEPGKLHGLIASPNTFSYTHSLVPILSIGRMSAFRDIMIPCPCYLGYPVMGYDPIPFVNKIPALYWRGSSTGLKALKFTWKFGHRQRFVAFVKSIQAGARVLDAHRFFMPEASDLIEGKRVKLFKDFFDVQMSEYIQCQYQACNEMEQVLGPGGWEPEETSLGYQFVYDIDGNSMSTRFYRLLSSQSVVLKQSWIQEWHDDRLVPWVHYIPVTMGMDELPSLINFLVNDPEGKRLSIEISREGSTWSRQVLRRIDMSIYVYRLLLELAEIYSSVESQ